MHPKNPKGFFGWFLVSCFWFLVGFLLSKPLSNNEKQETRNEKPIAFQCDRDQGGSWRDRLRTLASIMYFQSPAPLSQSCFFFPSLSHRMMLGALFWPTFHSTRSMCFNNSRRRYMPEKANPLNSILLGKREARAKKSRLSGSLNRLDSKLSSFSASFVSEDIAYMGR